MNDNERMCSQCGAPFNALDFKCGYCGVLRPSQEPISFACSSVSLGLHYAYYRPYHYANPPPGLFGISDMRSRYRE